MATVKNNLATMGLAGKVGNLVFRKRGDKTTVYVQSQRTKPLTEKQKKAQLLFAQAVAKAKQALKDPIELMKFEELAKRTRKESAYSAAVSYFCKQAYQTE